ncbi:MAG TPA: hypothetical protein VNX70_08930, partial [Bryobacteraceae bacterium]|nr:hypothetical protein [Bryobacteraceae bacterium]
MAFFVLLATAAWAGIVAAGFLGGYGLFFLRGRAVAADELQLGHFSIFLPLNIAREIFDYVLSGAALLAVGAYQGFFGVLFFLVFFIAIGREGQHRLSL